ncbi:universal stress protein [Ammoniphilus sp. 3BR4]
MSRCRKTLQNALENYSSIPNKVSSIVMEGSVLLEQADQLNCDTIVLGCRGLSSIKELVLGSVSHQVVQRSSAMVLIVK